MVVLIGLIFPVILQTVINLIMLSIGGRGDKYARNCIDDHNQPKNADHQQTLITSLFVLAMNSKLSKSVHKFFSQPYLAYGHKT